jgi:hypothetical protein
VYVTNCCICFPGLPLTFDIEGPASDSDVTFILGARPTTTGYDLSIAGGVAAAVFAPSRAPAMFSGCVLECLESLMVNVTGTSLTSTPFSVSSRQLRLMGRASPEEVQQVLRSAVYLNRAPSLNVVSFQLEVS